MTETMNEYMDLTAIRKAANPLEAFIKVPPDARHERVSFEAVKRDPACIRYVPIQSLSGRIIKKVTKKDVDLLKWIPEKGWKQNLAMVAVRTDPLALPRIPESHRTVQVCKETLKGNLPYYGDDILDILWAIPHPQLILEALKACEKSFSHNVSSAFLVIESKNLTNEVIDYALAKDASLIQFLPDHLKTGTRCLNAVKEQGFNLVYVPDEKKILKLCLIALESDIWALRFFPEKYLTPDFVNTQVRKNPDSLSNIQIDKRTYEACRYALKKGDPRLSIRTITFPDLLIHTIKNNRGKFNSRDFSMAHLNPDLLSHAKAKEILTLIPWDYPYMPEHLKLDKELAHLAVELEPENLLHIPDAYKDEAICIQAIKCKSSAVCGLPPHLKNQAFYIQLIKETGKGDILIDIPEIHKSYKVCKVAYYHLTDNTSSASAFVVSHMPFDTFWIEKLRSGDKEAVESLLRNIPMEKQTIDFGLEVVKKEGDLIGSINPRLIRSDMCEIAVNNGLRWLKDIPTEFRSAEICLQAVKNNQTNEKYVPKEVAGRSNVYTLNRELEKRTGQFFTVDETKRIYHGKPFHVSILILNDKTYRDMDVKWDRKSQQLIQLVKQQKKKTIHKGTSIKH